MSELPSNYTFVADKSITNLFGNSAIVPSLSLRHPIQPHNLAANHYIELG